MYRRQYKQPWKFTKPGIILLRDKAIIILEEGTHLTQNMPNIITDPEYGAKYGLPESIVFDQWFDIIDPMENSVPAKFRIETTSLADSLLLEYGLENEFPAITIDPVKGRTYYFSGDFTHANVPVWTSKFKGVEKLKRIFYSNKPEDTRRFFWLYYKPLIKGIFNDYYNSLQSK
jgi:hypothetical protein